MEQFNQATTYEDNSSVQREDGIFLMNQLGIEEGNNVLDLGCGTGYLTRLLADRVGTDGEVVGIDPDSQRLQIAEDKYSSSNLHYLARSGEDIPGNACYDVIFSNSVLHWCEDKDLVFKQVQKSLKEGGKFGFVTPADFDAVKELFSPANMFSLECRESMIEDCHYVSSYEHLQLAIANNFSLVYFKKHVRDWRFQCVNELIEALMTHHHGFDSSHFNAEAMREHIGIIISDCSKVSATSYSLSFLHCYLTIRG